MEKGMLFIVYEVKVEIDQLIAEILTWEYVHFGLRLRMHGGG
jgi:hypothetical protein